MKGSGVVRRVLSIAMLVGTLGCGAETGTGPADEADTVSVSSELQFPCFPSSIPSCSSCKLLPAIGTSIGKGDRLCLPSQYQRVNGGQIEVVTSVGRGGLNPPPSQGGSFSLGVSTSSIPEDNAYLQLYFNGPTGPTPGLTVPLPK